MTKEVAISFVYASIVSPLVPLVCLFVYRKSQPRQNLILAISLGISLLFDVIGYTLAVIYRENAISNNLYFIIAFPAIMWFYHETLVKATLKMIIRVFTVVFLVLALISAIDQGLYVLNFNTMTLSSILVSITSFFFVADLKLMNDSDFSSNPFHETNIIVNTSLATYYFVTIVVFALTDYIDDHFSPEDARYMWVTHNAVHILKNLGLAFAFYIAAKRSEALVSDKKSIPVHHD
jgi:hypothetical protein